MVQIKQQLVSQSIIKQRSYGYGNTKKYVVVHETANLGKGANAQAHANIQSRLNPRKASWNYQVDDKEIIQSFPDDVKCWHSGSTYYNENSIGIEICVNSDGNFKKAVANAAALVRHLINKYNIPISNVIQHRTSSGWKDCPHFLRSGSKGITWGGFINLVKEEGIKITNGGSSKAPASSGSSKSTTPESIVDWMIANKMDSSFTNRTKLAAKHGIKNYTGTAEQNIKLLNKLKNDKSKPAAPVSKPTNSSKGNMKTDSIVEYLDSIKVDSSFTNRAKLAAKHGIKNYTGTASQNTTLLNKLRSGASAAPSKTKPKGDMKTDSIVDYLKSINENSSMNNRKKLAAKHGIKNYTGTAAQNKTLLKKLRGN